MRKILKNTWTVFFSRYASLTVVQKKAVPLIMAKKNALLISQTASGKTEAVIVPLLERLLTENWQGLSIIYIAPTKALVNDLNFRLKELCKEIHVSVCVKTGDKPQFNPAKLTDILITTPESFDSILCRYQKSLHNLRSIILDEIHLLDNTYRGDQLRVLLKRAQEISQYQLNIYLLSATVAEPEKLGNRYAQDIEIIEIPGSRIINNTNISSFEELREFASAEHLRKILVFCNRRASVEEYANVCKKIWGNHLVVAHHGSLSAKIRHEAEAFMKQNYFGICVSTMTLEIGVDIGSVDAVVLAEVPLSISAFLQRIGRSNRRSQTIRTFGLCTTDSEIRMLESMLKAAKQGFLEKYSYQFDYAVIIQQIFSLLYSSPLGFEEDYLVAFMEEFCEEKILIGILNHLETLNWIKKNINIWTASTVLMNLGDIGKIHSNIPDTKAYKVINILNKAYIGEVTGRVNSVFLLAGNIWKIVYSTDGKFFVKPVSEKFNPTKFKISWQKSQFEDLLPLNYQQESLAEVQDH
ncbi:MAG: DEAD/DEAH box helicase [Candidatus Stygibacter frigidus]|nr:DEAD/DEAH box helicase [Candidatus Stygibacter frigidus]